MKNTRPLILAIVALLSLSACGQQPTVPVAATFTATFKDIPANQQTYIISAIQNVITGRLGSLGVTPTDLTVEPTGSGAAISLTVDSGVANALNAEMTSPYTVRFMRKAGTGETATQTVAKYGGFVDTGLNESDVTWIQASKDAQGLGEVTIGFNDAGHALLKTLSQSENGVLFGLFAKGKLISVFTMSSSFGGDITLEKIPSADLAQVFADDVNVGLHVTFTRTDAAAGK